MRTSYASKLCPGEGEAGPAGDQGEVGPAGAQGEAGPPGEVGPAGPAGGAGGQGPQGIPGMDGADGMDGMDGVACADDADCDDGSFCNGVESCVDGVCQVGTSPSCDDGINCTVDVCDDASAACINITADNQCNLGLMCHPTLDCIVRPDTTSLVGAWSFTGGGVVDGSGNGIVATPQDDNVGNTDGDTPPMGIDGPGGGGLSFDGVDDVLILGNDAAVDIAGSEVTLDFWFRWDGTTPSNAFINKEFQYEVGLQGGELSSALRTGGSWAWLDSGYVVPTDTWVHLAVVYDGTDVIYYASGVEVGRVAHPAGGALISDGRPLRLGARDVNRDGTTDSYVNVDLANVRIWDRALTDSEVNLFANY